MFLPSDITLQFGDNGDFVAEMQRRLVAVSAGGKNLITGHFDGMTVNAVSSFQASHGIRADGIAGPDTLRRLNAVYSGDALTESDTKKDEEENAKAAEAVQREALLLQQAALTPEPVFVAPIEETAAASHITAPPVAAYAPAEQKPLANPQNAVENLAQREAFLQQQAQQQAQQYPSPSDILAQMLLNPPTPPASEKTAPPQRPPLSEHAAVMPPAVDPNAATQVTAAPHSTREATAQPREAESGQPSLMQRSVKWANEKLQQFANHFEEKLRPADLHTVQQAGRMLAQAGVKETAIPTGPELPTRAPELPTRGPEQQTQIQRG